MNSMLSCEDSLEKSPSDISEEAHSFLRFICLKSRVTEVKGADTHRERENEYVNFLLTPQSPWEATQFSQEEEGVDRCMMHDVLSLSDTILNGNNKNDEIL